MPSLVTLFEHVDWEEIVSGYAGRFHGDFHFENILFSTEFNEFVFLE